jgi:TolB protein
MAGRCSRGLMTGLLLQLIVATFAGLPAELAATSVASNDGGGTGVIAYCYYPLSSGLPQIYGIRTDGSDNTKITNSPTGLNHHSWSPDGKKIAAVGYVSGSTWSIYVCDAAGGNLMRLTTASGVQDAEPSWSPDGSKIAFSRVYPSQNDRSELWVMDSDGGNAHSIEVAGFSAKWSPDGARFVYQTGMMGTGSDICFCDVDGTNVQPLVIWTPSADEINPAWSPDGSRLAFASNIDMSYEIYTVNVDGSDPHQLTDNMVFDHCPKWSPDGTIIAFDSGIVGDPLSRMEIYLIDADGSNLRRLTWSPAGITAINPDWQPTESTVVAVCLADFTCRQDRGAVMLDWRTESEATPGDFQLSAEMGDVFRDVPVLQAGAREFEALDDDPCLRAGGTVVYKLQARRDDGTWTLIRTERVQVDPAVPGMTFLNVYPNPFNPGTSISFTNILAQTVMMSIFDVGGRRVRTLAEREFPAGGNVVYWDGLDDRGVRAPSGVYLLRLRAGKDRESRKLMLVR